MAKEKNPYGKFSIEEVRAAETNAFIIQIGSELFHEGHYYAFTKDKVDKYYDSILSGMRDILKNGTKKEMEEAKYALWNFRVIPLRIQ